MASKTPRSYVISFHLRQPQLLADMERTVWIGAVAALPFVSCELYTS